MNIRNFQYPVNVSSVPQLSVFRYPGGKTWFIPYLRLWLSNTTNRPSLLCEPFAGGGIVSLTCAAEKLTNKVHINELDPVVAAVWRTTLSADYDWLCKRILEFNLTIDNVTEILSSDPVETRDKAFKTILRNRTGHGGILAEGGGLLKHGENGRGIASRWYPSTLAKRIRTIYSLREQIIFSEEDGLDLIDRYKDNSGVAFFIDPPYTAGKNGKRAGKRLYRISELDHDRLFKLAKSIKGDFLMTYDDDSEVTRMAELHEMKVALIPMKNTHNATMNEVVISRDLSWADENLNVSSIDQLDLDLKIA